MKPKKNPRYDLEKKRHLLFILGFPPPPTTTTSTTTTSTTRNSSGRIDVEIEEELEFEEVDTEDEEEIEFEEEEEVDEVIDFAVVEGSPIYPGCKPSKKSNIIRKKRRR